MKKLFVFGVVVIYNYEYTHGYVYVNFDNYDYNTSNYILATETGQSFEVLEQNILDNSYEKITYSIPAKSARYTYNGVSHIDNGNAFKSLVGLPVSGSTTITNADYGLCDLYFQTDVSQYGHYCALSRAAYPDHDYRAGIFTFSSSEGIEGYYGNLGLRTMLT